MSDKKPDIKSGAPSSTRHKAKSKKTPSGERDEKTPNFNSVVHPKTKPNNHHKGISRASAVFLALMATLTGGAIGWLGPVMFKSTAQTDMLTQTIDTLRAELTTETRARKTQEQTLKTLQDSFKVNGANTAQLNLSLSEQGKQIATLLTNSESHNLNDLQSSFEDLTARVDAQETLGNGGGDSAGAKALLARITALEEHINDQKNNEGVENTASEFPKENAQTINLPKTQSKTLSSQKKAEIIQGLVESFPRAEMLAAVQAQQEIASKKPSWLQKTLSKHIKVRDDNTPPLTLIEGVEQAVKAGRLEDALSGIKKLNPPVRAVARDWVIAVKKAQKTLNLTDQNNIER